MNSYKLSDWLQLTGTIAVIASLIFVGLQIRQAHEIAVSNAYQTRTRIVAGSYASNASNQLGLAAWHKSESDGLDTLTPGEVWAGRQMTNAVIRIWDNTHYQIETGFIPVDALPGLSAEIKAGLRNPFIRRHLDSRLDRLLRPTFRDFVIDIGKELDDAPDE